MVEDVPGNVMSVYQDWILRRRQRLALLVHDRKSGDSYDRSALFSRLGSPLTLWYSFQKSRRLRQAIPVQRLHKPASALAGLSKSGKGSRQEGIALCDVRLELWCRGDGHVQTGEIGVKGLDGVSKVGEEGRVLLPTEFYISISSSTVDERLTPRRRDTRPRWLWRDG